MKIIGVDIGGTKIDAALIENNRIVTIKSGITPAKQSKEEVVEAIIKVVEMLNPATSEGIGIGVPGLYDLDTNEVIDVVHIPSWKRVPLKRMLEQRFQKPVFVNNDANCFAIGEKYFGKGKPYSNFVGLTIGTAMGGGIIIDNRLYSGKFCGAGEFGAMFFRDKTVEDYASGLFFKDKGLSGSELSERAFAGDKDAIRLFDELGENIGNAISNILFTLAPEAIILGGSVSDSFPLFEKGMRNFLKKFPYQQLYQSVKIEVSDLQNSAVLGAASLVLDSFNKKN